MNFPAVLLLLMALARAANAAMEVPPAVPPLPGTWRAVPAFSDEFNSPTLDSRKWQPNNPEWPGRPPGFYREQNIVLKNGRLELLLKAENVPEMPAGYKDYTCAIVRSRQRIRYGYFEIRARAGASAGTSAFWFYHNEPQRWLEIDVFELAPGHARYGRTLFTNAPVIRYPGLTRELAHKQEFPLRMDPSAGFHTWGLLWNADLLTWYLDGKPLRSLSNTYWKAPLRLILDTETHPDWMGLPAPATLPSAFVIDYIRTWQSTLP